MRALFRRPTPPGNVVFTFRVDAIAQECNETLLLELVPTFSTTLPTEDGVFFRRYTLLTIMDSDCMLVDVAVLSKYKSLHLICSC